MNFAQIEQLWTSNGGDPQWAPLMAGIALAESGGNPQALNNNPATGDYSVGLWQINYYGPLLGPRTQSYGSPASLQADPNAQAVAAINLFGRNGAGIGNWKGDRIWNAWQAAGAPQAPNAGTVLGWLASSNVGAGTASAMLTGAAGSGGGKQIGCSPSGGIDIFGAHIGTGCQIKALKGGLLAGIGATVMLAGGVLVAAYGLSRTRVGTAALGIATKGRAQLSSVRNRSTVSTSSESSTSSTDAGDDDYGSGFDDGFMAGVSAQSTASTPAEGRREGKRDARTFGVVHDTPESRRPGEGKRGGVKASEDF